LAISAAAYLDFPLDQRGNIRNVAFVLKGV
jgi:hypothetical protein